MKEYLFKLFFKLALKFAPDDKLCRVIDIYMELEHADEQKQICENRQKQADEWVRPRTETHEHLTCARQREIFSKGKLIRGNSAREKLARHTDYTEAKKYHENG